MYLEGFLSVITDPEMYLVILLGVAVGIVFGAIPGLTATMAITMCLPMTYAMETKTAVCVLMALYIGGISGGLISAILLNIPGTPSSLATTFDGAPMAASGHAKKALGVGVFYSFIGTMVGLVILMGVAPQLSKIAIKFSPLEYCALAIFSLVLVIALAGKDMIKGLISGTLGLMFATVGLSPIDSMKRFTFGNVNLTGGFQLLTLLIGLYAITEIAAAAFEAVHPKDMTIRKTEKVKGFGFSLKEFKDNIGNMSISALIGTAIGILPGIGGGTAGLLAYSVEKSRSKHPEKYGTGCMEGVVASETSNNAVIGGAMVPLLTLGIPGDGATAMLLGASINSFAPFCSLIASKLFAPRCNPLVGFLAHSHFFHRQSRQKICGTEMLRIHQLVSHFLVKFFSLRFLTFGSIRLRRQIVLQTVVNQFVIRFAYAQVFTPIFRCFDRLQHICILPLHQFIHCLIQIGSTINSTSGISTFVWQYA